ncbi:Peroxisomal targeting signal 1 receptor [Metarhizium album ARSEF 1941]|uniref:Peroxisomal targeting signal 1 receptor n=1 Tax=Metarhizium album (strain ARSEF 1941) TaxID=1081103 RepID=A0A0B2WP38_METAS|nr:Peroxisomal targeting signal 1 receptor [Metarhizium album ARSEF 1941]KHN94745.1 Peroxisomal targeting signal 1 receptor [Metarhizium album ARSEF 1941]
MYRLARSSKLGKALSTTSDETSGGQDEKTSAEPEALSVPAARDNHASGKHKPPKSTLGLQILHDCDEPTIECALQLSGPRNEMGANDWLSIVAVHGLGANPDYAWIWLPKNNPPDSPGYPDEPFNWLQKLLPAKLSCRVLAFNYDSAWFANAPQQRLSHISDNLLDSLRHQRDEVGVIIIRALRLVALANSLRKQVTNRPLIFIGHSFGGNVIEQAIVSASRHCSEYLSIAESTAGVIFLGTPHRGSPAARWGAMIASLASPGFVTEDRLLKALDEQSDSLADRLRDFSRWLFSDSVPVVCAFEQLMTDYSSRAGFVGKLLPSKELIVPESSACIDGHHRIALNTDHLKINKFYGPDDPSFKRIYPHIVRMVETACQRLNRRRNPIAIPTDESCASDDLKKCLRKMRVTNPLDVLSNIHAQKGERVENTCQWILNREEFSAWAASKDAQLLRLVGSPGIGKTIMSTFLVEVLREKVEKTADKTFAYFFCDDKNQDRKTPTAILRSLVWQLLLQRNELFRHVQPDFEKHAGDRVFEDFFNSFSALWRVFCCTLQDERAGEVFILIDALDECESSTRQHLLVSIKKLFQLPPGKVRRNIKLLITCRLQISDIEDELQGVGVSVQMGSAVINDDLAKYIDDKVGDLASKKKYTPSLKQKVSETLKREAGSTFLWVSLMIAELRAVLMHQVEEKLKDLPHGIDDTYASILDRIPRENTETAQFILRCMAVARRPLRKTEIQTAFATWKTGLVRRGEDGAVYADILSVCSSILYVSSGDDATINFCHQSVKDFLLLKRSKINKWYHTAEAEANLQIFKACWAYLSAEAFNNGKNASDLRRQFSQHLFLEYSSREWDNHATASYPAVLGDWHELATNVTKAPMLRDAWLLRAAREGQEGIARLLLENGAEANFKDSKYGRTPLLWASEKGHEAIVKLLLENGAKADSKDSVYNRTLLSLTSRNGQEAIAKLLLDHGAEVDSKSTNGRTPLSWAAEKGHEAVVKLLLQNGANVHIADKTGRTALSWAAEKRHTAVVKLLLQKGAKEEREATAHLPVQVEVIDQADADSDSHQDPDGHSDLPAVGNGRRFGGHWGTYVFAQDNIFRNEKNAFREGVELMKQGGNLSLAALLLEAAVQQHPDQVEAWLYLGQAQAQNEEETAAILAMEQVLKHDANNLDALMSLSVSYSNEGYDSEAVRTLERWLSVKYSNIMDPKDVSPKRDLSYRDRKRLYHKVVRLFSEAAQLSPDREYADPDVQVGLGVLFQAVAAYDKAIECFQLALHSSALGTANQHDQAHLLWNRLGAVLANNGAFEDAIAAYEQALSISPNFVRARSNLGISCITTDPRLAVCHLLTALKIHNSVEKSGRAKIYEILGGGNHQVGETLGRVSAPNRSKQLHDTLRSVFRVMKRKDLEEKLVEDVDLDVFRPEFDF